MTLFNSGGDDGTATKQLTVGLGKRMFGSSAELMRRGGRGELLTVSNSHSRADLRDLVFH